MGLLYSTYLVVATVADRRHNGAGWGCYVAHILLLLLLLNEDLMELDGGAHNFFLLSKAKYIP